MKGCFNDITAKTHSISSDEIGVEQFFNITTMFKKELLLVNEQQKGEELLDAIRSKLNEEDLFGIIGVFIVTGIKPIISTR